LLFSGDWILTNLISLFLFKIMLRETYFAFNFADYLVDIRLQVILFLSIKYC